MIAANLFLAILLGISMLLFIKYFLPYPPQSASAAQRDWRNTQFTVVYGFALWSFVAAFMLIDPSKHTAALGNITALGFIGAVWFGMVALLKRGPYYWTLTLVITAVSTKTYELSKPNPPHDVYAANIGIMSLTAASLVISLVAILRAKKQAATQAKLEAAKAEEKSARTSNVRDAPIDICQTDPDHWAEYHANPDEEEMYYC